jgi:hypothetical protein
MSDDHRRKALRAQYKETRPPAGVYRIVNRHTHKVLVGSALNLDSVRNKLAFAQATGTPTVLDRRLIGDLQTYGIDAFALEVLDVLPITPELSETRIREDLATLEQLWRDKEDPGLLY